MTTSHFDRRAQILSAVEQREPERRRIYAEWSAADKTDRRPSEAETNLRTKDGARIRYGGAEPGSKRR